MKRKIFSILLVLVLVLTFSLVTAVPVAAQSTLNVVPFTLITAGDGSAAWSTAQPHSGTSSVLLDAGTSGGANAGRIEVLVDPIPLADFTGASYYVWEPTGTQHGGEFPYITAHPYGDPYINIYLDTDGDGVVDEYLEGLGSVAVPASALPPTTHPTPTAETWVQMEEGYGFYDSDDGLSSANWTSAHAVGTLAEWKTYLATAYTDPPVQVVGVKITFGFWADEVTPDVYVDDIAINGVVYYGLIQDAIDSATAGDTINVAAGTYTENIVVDKSLTIQAASSPVIDGGGNLGPGVHITAANVTFQGFTITNFTCTPTAGIGAILVEGDGAIIDHNIIYDILPQGDPLSAPAGIGIDVHASNVMVTNNIVHDVGSIGIRVRHDWDTAPTVSNNVLLEKNEVYRTGNTGVLVTGYAKGVTVRENEIYESLEPTEYNLFVHYGASDVLIENNIIRDPYNSIYGHNVFLAGCDNVTISGNTITGAASGKNIYIVSDYLPWVDAELLSTNVNIINNDIQNGAWGVRITNAAATDPSQMPATTTINYNNISGNTSYGVENTIATAVDAEYNWWGDVAGPSHAKNPYNTPTTGDVVSDNVDYLPWMIHDTLVTGWNIWSTPIAAATGQAGEPDTNTIAEALDFWGADYTKVTDAYYFNSATQLWAVPTSLTPLQAVYLKLSSAATIDVCVSDSNYAPPGRTMHLGWNLVGPAELEDMYVEDALITALWGTGQVNLIGYQYVISPSVNQASWTFMRGDGPTEEFIPTEGYWVWMVNQGTLAGFTYTPIVEVP